MGMTQASLRSWASLLLPTAAALWGSGWGCGGVITDSGRHRDGGSSQEGAGGGISLPGAGGAKPKPPGPTCGNGIVEGNELCDTNAFRGDLSNCQAALMAPNYAGKLLCTTSCTLDTSGCFLQFGAGGASYGGGPNGGSFGMGGYAGGYVGGYGGMLGFPNTPANDCYLSGGIPDSSSGQTCVFGSEAVNACFSKPNREPCAAKCGCSYCQTAFDRCESDGACWWLFACAQQNACYSVSACQQPCSQFFSMAGGTSTPSAFVLDQTLGCFATNSCPLKCP